MSITRWVSALTARQANVAARRIRRAPVGSGHPSECDLSLARLENTHIAVTGVNRNDVTRTQIKRASVMRAHAWRAFGIAWHRVINPSAHNLHRTEFSSRLNHVVPSSQLTH